MKQKGFAPILIVIVVAVLAVGGAYYFGYDHGWEKSTKSQTSQTPHPTQNPTASPSAELLPSFTENEGITPEEQNKILPLLNKEYVSKNGFSIKYPDDWKITEESYLNSVTLINESASVSINISEGQYPYGFSGPTDFQSKDLKLFVDGKEYLTKEFTNASGGYVDFKVGKGSKSFNILYGANYPAVNTQNTSLNEYLLNEDMIRYILTTFKFTQ